MAKSGSSAMPLTPSLEDSWSARVCSVSSVLVALVCGLYIRSRPSELIAWLPISVQ